MGYNKVALGLVISVLFLSGITTAGDMGISALSDRQDYGPQVVLSDYTPHASIDITDNSNFSTLGFTGTGSEEDPYIIENLSIVSDEVCIDITDTTEHFKIRNCYLAGDSIGTNAGIRFTNVDNGTIENCTITWRSNGIYIGSSSDCVIDNVETYNTSLHGADLVSSAYCNITNSYFHGFTASCQGIQDSSSHTFIYNCTIRDAHIGIWFLAASYPTVDSCTIQNSGSYAIYVSATYPRILNSHIQGNDNGIYINTGNTRIIHNNTISHNDGISIWCHNTLNSNVTDNRIFNNNGYGIYLEGITQNNYFYGNQIGWHSGNAFDDSGRINYFDNGVSVGNAWSDYSGTGLYGIPGSSGISDNYPSILSDAVAPFGTSPGNSTFGQGTIGNTVTWTAYDEWPDIYTVYIDDAPLIADWLGSDIELSLDHLTEGVHNVTILANDCGGNSIKDTIFADVYLFDLVQVDDISYESGTSDHWLNWLTRCAFPTTFEIQVDSEIYTSGVWYGENIEFNTDHFPIGNHVVTLILTNSTSDQLFDYVNVEVSDTLAPTVVDLGFYIYELGFPKQITWNADDANPTSFEIFKNGSSIYQDSWDGGQIEILAQNLELGLFNYTIVLTDAVNHTSVDTMLILVIDTTAPTISHPVDVVVEEGMPSVVISWTANDYCTGTYVILVDGSEYSSGTSLTETIEIVTSLFTVGNYNVTFVATDSSGNSASDTVWLTIETNLAPAVTGPASLGISEGQLGVWIRWNCSDANPATYRIQIDITTVESGVWDGFDIFYALSNIPHGQYNVTLIVSDIQGLESSFTVEVVVQQVTTTTTNTTTTSTTNNTVLTDVIDQLEVLRLTLILVGGVAVFSVIVSVVLLVSSKRGS